MTGPPQHGIFKYRDDNTYRRADALQWFRNKRTAKQVCRDLNAAAGDTKDTALVVRTMPPQRKRL
jgi:hypothetical protein